MLTPYPPTSIAIALLGDRATSPTVEFADRPGAPGITGERRSSTGRQWWPTCGPASRRHLCWFPNPDGGEAAEPAKSLKAPLRRDITSRPAYGRLTETVVRANAGRPG